MSDKNANETHKPHTAILSIQLEVHSLLDTGECSGRTVNKEVLKDYDISPAFLATVSGYTMDDCLKKLQQKIKELRDDDVESK
jgi:hypothetical protein